MKNKVKAKAKKRNKIKEIREKSSLLSACYRKKATLIGRRTRRAFSQDTRHQRLAIPSKGNTPTAAQNNWVDDLKGLMIEQKRRGVEPGLEWVSYTKHWHRHLSTVSRRLKWRYDS